MNAETRTEPAGAAARVRRVAALRGLLPFLKPYRGRIVLSTVILLVGSVAMLSVPLGFRDLIDHAFAAGPRGPADTQGMHLQFLVLFAIAGVWAIAVGLRYFIVSWIGERVTADLRSAVYAHVLKQSPQFFETLRAGEVLSRLTGDITLVQTVVGSSMSMGLRSMVQGLGALVMLAVTSVKLFAINIVLTTALVLPLLLIGRHVRRLSRESQDRLADASAVAGEVLNAAPTVQAYTQESREAERFTGMVETTFDTGMRRIRVRAVMISLLIAAVFGAILFVLWLGARDVLGGRMTGGELASFVFYAILVAGSTSTVAEVWGDMLRASGATERLIELLHARSPIVSPAQARPLPGAGRARVDFEHVTFRYPSRPQTAALGDFSLAIAAGETVAFVGPSGAGKTTVFQLIQRFYDVSGGRVMFNGVDVRELPLADLRGAIAIVPQEPVLFSTDALENIRYGRPRASDEEVRAAATAALAAEFIDRLPQGYRTHLGERGVRLSGGQRQRIAIARAILKNAPLLLLDEATSALDSESEQYVQRGLEAAMRGRTTLIIAHRLSTVQRADRIVVMDHGRIVEIGDADALKRSGGLYARLADLQLTPA
ncbi:MAG: putative multidrug export ATP-binding/permease protein [Gammaproteobacteria bacterium]|nr:putative multidrug export ATP-binding/permease protein [Gammaproteobacteria bacterium]